MKRAFSYSGRDSIAQHPILRYLEPLRKCLEVFVQVFGSSLTAPFWSQSCSSVGGGCRYLGYIERYVRIYRCICIYIYIYIYIVQTCIQRP